MKRAGWAHLLEDEDVRRWHENLARGSPVTADENIRVLYRYLRRFGMTPRELSDRAKVNRRAVEDQLQDFIGDLEREGKAPQYILNYVKAVKSWLGFNEITLVRRFKVTNAYTTPSLEDERVPTPEELRAILGAATERGRVITSLMAFSGIRPEVMGDHRGNDGLRVKDLPDLKIEAKTVTFDRTPAMVSVRAPLSKAGHAYFSFLTEEGCEYLRAHLERRMASGEAIGPKSAIVSVTRGFEWKGHGGEERRTQFIVSRNVTREVRLAMRPRFQWRPYVLRAYFDTELLLAESRGKVAHDYRVFWMGHKGGMEARYTTNKGRLTKTLVDDMREAYARCEPFLATVPSRQQADAETNVAKVMLTGLGYTEAELGKVDFASLDPQAFQALVRRKMVAGAEAPKQQVVGLAEVPALLERGWTVALALNHSQAVLNPPGYAGSSSAGA